MVKPGKRRRTDGWAQVPVALLTDKERRTVNRVLKTACAYVAYERRQIARGSFTDVMDQEQRALHEAVDALERILEKKKKPKTA